MTEYLDKLYYVVNSVSKFTDKAWDDFSGLFRQDLIKKGTYFVEEGCKPREVAFIIDGCLRAFYSTPDGTEYNKTFFVENMFAVSLAAVIQRSESYLSFQALTDTNVLIADFFEFALLFDRHRCIETFYRIVLELEWVLKKEQREIRLAMYDAEERYKFFREEYPGLENMIPQYHIASHLGITPIQLSRIRAKMVSR